MEQVCFVCTKSLSEGETVVVERGLKTLRDASAERNDGKMEHLRNINSIKIHVQCRKDYTRRNSIIACKRERNESASTSTNSPPRSRMREREQSFNLKEQCIFCGEEASEVKERKKDRKTRQKIKYVSTVSFKDSIIAMADNRGDDIANAVKKRIMFENDLVAAQAKYHHNCYHSFVIPATAGKVGRPKDNNVSLAMEDVFSYIENSEDCQFTLTELKGIYTTYFAHISIRLVSSADSYLPNCF